MNRTEGYAVSCAQEAMWFVDGFNSTSRENELRVAFKIEKQTNIDYLCQKIIDIINQNSELRSYFRTDDSGLLKFTAPQLNIDDIVKYHQETGEDEFIHHVLSEKFDLKSDHCLIKVHLNQSTEKHLMVIRVHHIISDFHFIETIINQLFKNNHHYLFSPTTLADSQSKYINSSEYHDDIHFWSKQLKQQKTVLELLPNSPTDTAFNGRICKTQIKGKLYAKIKQYGEHAHLSPARLLSQMFALTLYRLSGQNEFCMGLSVSMRKNNPEIGLGYAVNVLPIPYHFSPDQSVNDTLSSGNTTILDALHHSQLPLKRIVETCAPERSLSTNPLFNVCFNFQKLSQTYQGSLSALLYGSQGQPVTIDQTTLEPFDIDQIDCQFDLLMAAEETTDGFDIFLLHKENVISQKTAEGILANFVHFSDVCLQQPERTLREFSFTTGKAQSPFNPQPGSTSRTLVDWLNETAAKYPEHVALRYNDTQLTYQSLFRLADNLAHQLIEYGVKRGDKIPLCFNPGPDMIVALLAVLKCGACYVPINPAYPDSRVSDILSDIQATNGLVEESLTARFEPLLERVVVPELDVLAQQTPTGSLASFLPDGEDLAYIIYTSGSTGKPKGVQICHRNVVRLFTTSDDHFRFCENDVWTLYHSFAFDFSVWEIFGALLYGGRLVIVPYLISRSPEEFSQLVEQEQVTVLNQTPTAFSRFSESCIRNQLSLRQLRVVVFGGEALNLVSLLPWYNTYGERVSLINMYGITETTVHVTYRPLTRQDCLEDRGSLIGMPLNDLGVVVMDPFGHPLPIGWPGEMYVAGEGLAKGYFNRPELTAEKFIEKNLGGETLRLYRSGDLARFISDQEIDYLGRIDHQVKIRGFRIELGDIQAKLSRIEAVSHAFVTTQKADNDTILIAYLLVNAPINYEQVIQGIAADLPEYMIPQQFYLTDEIPLTVNNKVDMKRLHDIATQLLPTVRNQIAESATEVTILSIWQAILGFDEIDLESDFFTMGGNSSSILKVYQQLNQHYPNQLLVTDLFKYRNIRSLSRFLADKTTAAPDKKTSSQKTARAQKRINQLKNRKQRQPQLNGA
ncbi:amino acid adenylation domain-containing protein [Vibrio rhizosphaerae]|uniref:Amino acid adenylation domain-containing protein n=1 Tax=Vibrio rhizosphaerae TaxID=398736 RepID=A0ABU4IWV8_9VIBR|nr:amino acid adenylation domain-containing protein [Vibrio rhizosphaerae]MDW6093860.1 amino acid adenylation domain-containing protein [Vibrio rhizosphaerae]